MVSLRTSKATLSDLIAPAERGEEILITVRGKPRAGLTAVGARDEAWTEGWISELERLHRKIRGKGNLPAARVVSDLRDER